MAKKKQTRAEWEAERRVRIKQIITDGIMSTRLPNDRKRAFLAALDTVSARIEKEETQAQTKPPRQSRRDRSEMTTR